MGAPGQDIPIAVQDVDSWQSFKMFEQGWILPADHKRRGRTAVERPPQPPPRKRAKTSTSLLSFVLWEAFNSYSTFVQVTRRLSTVM